MNSEGDSGKNKTGENDSDLAKASRSEITLDELDDLYRSEEAEKEAELASKRLMMASHSNLVTSIKVNSATPPPVVRMRSRDDMRFNNNKSSKKINRLSRKSRARMLHDKQLFNLHNIEAGQDVPHCRHIFFFIFIFCSPITN